MLRSLFCALALAASATAQTSLATVQIAGGLSKPLAVAAPAGDPTRVFVVEQTGRIRLVHHGVLLATPFLDLTSVIAPPVGELGLFSLVFHPSYASNGRFFVFYTRAGDTAGVVAEYGVSSDPNVALTSGRVVLVVPPSTTGDHQAGCLRFGLDGKLYVATGDGGSAIPGDPECDAQNGLSLLGKLLRIDVDGALPYAVPPDNPFVGNPAFRPEVWAYGLRNAWRYSFDRANGDLYLADVGQSTAEEIDYAPVGQAGMNFGWNVMEGTGCTGYAPCAGAPACGAASLTAPVWQYPHGSGNCAVIGGFVYRGGRIPSLAGSYFFADFCSGRIFTLDMVGGLATNVTDRTSALAPLGGGAIHQISSFGEDANGELYICDRSGKLWEIVPIDDCSIAAFGTSNANSTGAHAHLGGVGTASVAAGDLYLTATGLPPFAAGLPFLSSAKLAQCAPFGNGLVCIANPRQRMPLVTADAAGTLAVPFGAAQTSLYGITSSDVRYFQVWFRDPTGGGSLTNTTDALEVVFCR